MSLWQRLTTFIAQYGYGTVEAVTLGPFFDDGGEASPPKGVVAGADIGAPLGATRAEVVLSNTSENSYGGFYPLVAWTDTHVIRSYTFEGEMGLMAFPRHPVECKPGPYGWDGQ